MTTSTAAPKLDIYSRVTNEIINAIEAGATEFRMPWHTHAGAGRPRNARLDSLAG